MKKQRKNGFNPRIHAKHQLIGLMQEVVGAEHVNNASIQKLVNGIKMEQERVAGDKQFENAKTPFHAFADEELSYFMKLEAGVAADVRQKIRAEVVEADQIGQAILATLADKSVKWVDIKDHVASETGRISDIDIYIATLAQQLASAQIAVANVFASRYALTEVFYKHFGANLGAILERNHKAAVEWGLHANSTPAELKRFLDEKFSYADVLVPVVAAEVEEVVGDEVVKADDILDAEKPYVEPEEAVVSEVVDAVDPELAKAL